MSPDLRYLEEPINLGRTIGEKGCVPSERLPKHVGLFPCVGVFEDIVERLVVNSPQPVVELTRDGQRLPPEGRNAALEISGCRLTRRGGAEVTTRFAVGLPKCSCSFGRPTTASRGGRDARFARE